MVAVGDISNIYILYHKYDQSRRLVSKTLFLLFLTLFLIKISICLNFELVLGSIHTELPKYDFYQFYKQFDIMYLNLLNRLTKL